MTVHCTVFINFAKWVRTIITCIRYYFWWIYYTYWPPGLLTFKYHTLMIATCRSITKKLITFCFLHIPVTLLKQIGWNYINFVVYYVDKHYIGQIKKWFDIFLPIFIVRTFIVTSKPEVDKNHRCQSLEQNIYCTNQRIVLISFAEAYISNRKNHKIRYFEALRKK